MRSLRRYILSHFSSIYRGFFVIISLVLVVYLLPREGRFRHEYQKGKPWMEDVLIAPYDFPIYKAGEEIAYTRDSLERESKPYFNLDTTLLPKQLAILGTTFESVWKKHLAGMPGLTDSVLADTTNRETAMLMTRKERIYQRAVFLLSHVFNTGIIESSDLLNKATNKDDLMVVMRGPLAHEIHTSQVFTRKTAYEYFLEQYGLMSAAPDMQDEVSFLHDLSLEELIEPNLFYDEKMSHKVLQQAIGEISLTRGMVQTGERIIAKGELVDDWKFMVLESYRIEYERRLGSYGRLIILLGQTILAFSMFLAIYLFLLNFRKEVLQNKVKSSFILLLVLLFYGITAVVLKTGIASVYLIPVAIVPIILGTFYDTRLSIFVYMVTILLTAFLVPNSFEYVFLSFCAGIIAIISLTKIYRRGKLFMTAIYIFLAYSVVFFGMALIQEGSVSHIQWKTFLMFAGNGVLILLSYPMMYVFEKFFGFLSDARLVELSDTNQPLLRELAEKAPGTFQHSLQVANLAEQAATRTGSNPLLIRTGALYHDIGKMANPMYFIENQTDGINPHDQLESGQSAKIITDHVRKGVEMARRYNLPTQIIDFIRTHHGTNLVRFFYSSYLNKNLENNLERGLFSYPGPKPFSRAMAILMMADAVEAASRSLRNPGQEEIERMVENIINGLIADEQFTDADITFRHINEIKMIFKRRLVNIYHTRIAYPHA